MVKELISVQVATDCSALYRMQQLTCRFLAEREKEAQEKFKNGCALLSKLAEKLSKFPPQDKKNC